ncbi:MAG: hypothetical protein KH186_06290 [Lachnospiraceae bacterium]|nr:hypothetical protein [Lachnospiraceae bacterium]
MNVIYVDVDEQDFVKRNGEAAKECEKVVYSNSNGDEMISIEKDRNQFKITIDERYVRRIDPNFRDN